jgi:hypothetical protein
MILIVGPYLRVQEHSDCAIHPMLPVVWGDDCDALDLLLVASYEPGVGCERWSRFVRQAAKVDSPTRRMIHCEDAETVFV